MQKKQTNKKNSKNQQSQKLVLWVWNSLHVVFHAPVAALPSEVLKLPLSLPMRGILSVLNISSTAPSLSPIVGLLGHMLDFFPSI